MSPRALLLLLPLGYISEAAQLLEWIACIGQACLMSLHGCAWAWWQDLKFKQVCNSSQRPQVSEGPWDRVSYPWLWHLHTPPDFPPANMWWLPAFGAGISTLTALLLGCGTHTRTSTSSSSPHPAAGMKQAGPLGDRQGLHEKPRAREISGPLLGMTVSLDTTRSHSYGIIKVRRGF